MAKIIVIQVEDDSKFESIMEEIRHHFPESEKETLKAWDLKEEIHKFVSAVGKDKDYEDLIYRWFEHYNSHEVFDTNGNVILQNKEKFLEYMRKSTHLILKDDLERLISYYGVDIMKYGCDLSFENAMDITAFLLDNDYSNGFETMKKEKAGCFREAYQVDINDHYKEEIAKMYAKKYGK